MAPFLPSRDSGLSWFCLRRGFHPHVFKLWCGPPQMAQHLGRGRLCLGGLFFPPRRTIPRATLCPPCPHRRSEPPRIPPFPCSPFAVFSFSSSFVFPLIFLPGFPFFYPHPDFLNGPPQVIRCFPTSLPPYVQIATVYPPRQVRPSLGEYEWPVFFHVKCSFFPLFSGLFVCLSSFSVQQWKSLCHQASTLTV